MKILAPAVLLALAAPAEDNVLTDKEKAEGFRLIFDGKSLDGWDGNPKLWSVKDGAIVGETTKENPAKGNTFLIWKGGTVSDFELRFQFRLTGKNNSGVQYRSRDLGNWVAGGYQYDINPGAEHMGKLYEEKGKRGRMAMGGEKVTWKEKKELVGPTVDKDVLAKAEKREDWNEGAIVGKGNHILHRVNGVTVVDFTDEDEKNRLLTGIVALQIHAGAPMKIEFKTIRLKELK
jgi:hypothetical protein